MPLAYISGIVTRRVERVSEVDILFFHRHAVGDATVFIGISTRLYTSARGSADRLTSICFVKDIALVRISDQIGRDSFVHRVRPLLIAENKNYVRSFLHIFPLYLKGFLSASHQIRLQPL